MCLQPHMQLKTKCASHLGRHFSWWGVVVAFHSNHLHNNPIHTRTAHSSRPCHRSYTVSSTFATQVILGGQHTPLPCSAPAPATSAPESHPSLFSTVQPATASQHAQPAMRNMCHRHRTSALYVAMRAASVSSVSSARVSSSSPVTSSFPSTFGGLNRMWYDLPLA